MTIPKSDNTDDCDFELHSATDGKLLDFQTVLQGGSQLLDPYGTTQVYLANVECDVHIEAGRE